MTRPDDICREVTTVVRRRHARPVVAGAEEAADRAGFDPQACWAPSTSSWHNRCCRWRGCRCRRSIALSVFGFMLMSTVSPLALVDSLSTIAAQRFAAFLDAHQSLLPSVCQSPTETSRCATIFARPRCGDTASDLARSGAISTGFSRRWRRRRWHWSLPNRRYGAARRTAPHRRCRLRRLRPAARTTGDRRRG